MPQCPSSPQCPALAPPSVPPSGSSVPSPCPREDAQQQQQQHQRSSLPPAPAPVADACSSVSSTWWNSSLWGAFAAGYWESDAAAVWHPLTPFPPVPNVSVHVLAIGDSVDRHSARDLCNAAGRRSVSWAEAELPYDSGFASVYCELSPAASWAMLHHFGSRPQGPYLDGFRNVPSNRFVDTRLRIPRGIEHYQRVFGRRPTHVVYQANLWDVSAYLGRHGRNTTHLRTFLGQYIADVQETVRAIRVALSGRPEEAVAGVVVPHRTAGSASGPLVLLRTSVSLDPFVGSANTALAVAAAQAGVPLLDWAGLVATWGSHTIHGALFRDSHHPTANHTLIFMRRLLELAAAEPARGPLPPVVDVHATPSPAPTLVEKRRRRRRGRRRRRRRLE
jgi:hypothetical protein